MLSPLLFVIVVDLISENTREGLMNQILYADDLVSINESMENLKEVFKMKKMFESKRLNVNLKKMKVIGVVQKVKYSRVKLIYVPCAARV